MEDQWFTECKINEDGSINLFMKEAGQIYSFEEDTQYSFLTEHGHGYRAVLCENPPPPSLEFNKTISSLKEHNIRDVGVEDTYLIRIADSLSPIQFAKFTEADAKKKAKDIYERNKKEHGDEEDEEESEDEDFIVDKKKKRKIDDEEEEEKEKEKEEEKEGKEEEEDKKEEEVIETEEDDEKMDLSVVKLERQTAVSV